MSKRVVKVCDCCGKEKEVYEKDINGILFFTCSDKCKIIMLGRHNKKLWENLTPEERERRICKLNSAPKNNGKGLTEFWKVHNEKMLDHTVKIMKEHKGIVSVKERADLKLSQSPRVLLKAHAEVMKNDPERLTTEFCKNLMGIKCNYDKNEKDIQ